MRQAGEFAQRPDHRIQWIGDADDERVRRIGLDAFADGLHNLQIDAEQIVAAHPRLAGDTCRDDDDIGAGDIGVIIGALEGDIETFDRAALRQIERLALRHAFDNIEQHDITQSLGGGEMRQRATDVASADQRNFVASHGESDPSFESCNCRARIVRLAKPRNRLTLLRQRPPDHCCGSCARRHPGLRNARGRSWSDCSLFNPLRLSLSKPGYTGVFASASTSSA